MTGSEIVGIYTLAVYEISASANGQTTSRETMINYYRCISQIYIICNIHTKKNETKHLNV
jgi:hypothetical protein